MVKSAALFLLAALFWQAGPLASRLSPLASDRVTAREADFYHKLDNKLVACDLCPRRCVITPGQRGVCRVRENRDGRLYSVVYGHPCSVNKEPIEKAPLFHFLPGSQRITLATAGCNQFCKYCQNWEISQARPEDLQSLDLSPADVVALAVKEKAPIICFTYSEPVIFYEYMTDIARLARAKGIRTAVVTGGYINPEPLKQLCSMVDAIKIDLKGFTPEFYQNVCNSTLEPVLEACRIVAHSPPSTADSPPVHLELVNLVVPALNDDTTTIRKMCRWIRENVGDTVPVHFTAFHPEYRLQNSPPTPIATLERAIAIARSESLKFTYIGNVPGHQAENTYCPNCGKTLIKRSGYSIVENKLKNGKCPYCGAHIPGIWQ
jgi:pyruvate formate lyase activating enzyme